MAKLSSLLVHLFSELVGREIGDVGALENGLFVDQDVTVAIKEAKVCVDELVLGLYRDV